MALDTESQLVVFERVPTTGADLEVLVFLWERFAALPAIWVFVINDDMTVRTRLHLLTFFATSSAKPLPILELVTAFTVFQKLMVNFDVLLR